MKTTAFEQPVSIFVGLGFPRQVDSVGAAHQILSEWQTVGRAPDHDGKPVESLTGDGRCARHFNLAVATAKVRARSGFSPQIPRRAPTASHTPASRWRSRSKASPSCEWPLRGDVVLVAYVPESEGLSQFAVVVDLAKMVTDIPDCRALQDVFPFG
jgi:hypothetical protein